MEARPCTVLHFALYRHYWQRHEQVHLQVYAVSLPLFPPTSNLHISRLSLKHIASGGTVAEEVISTIRTAQAFGSQGILAGLYDHHIQSSYVVDAKAAIWHGGGLAIFFFVIYSAYALAFSFGTTLIGEGHGEIS